MYSLLIFIVSTHLWALVSPYDQAPHSPAKGNCVVTTVIDGASERIISLAENFVEHQIPLQARSVASDRATTIKNNICSLHTHRTGGTVETEKTLARIREAEDLGEELYGSVEGYYQNFHNINCGNALRRRPTPLHAYLDHQSSTNKEAIDRIIDQLKKLPLPERKNILNKRGAWNSDVLGIINRQLDEIRKKPLPNDTTKRAYERAKTRIENELLK